MTMVKFEKIKRPEKIGLPFMLDFYPLQDEKYTPVLVGDPEVFKEAASMCGIALPDEVEFISSGIRKSVVIGNHLALATQHLDRRPPVGR